MSDSSALALEGNAFAPDQTEDPWQRTDRIRSLKLGPVLVTAASVLVAGLLGFGFWESYVLAPWTRDATVRAYVVAPVPEVSGKIVDLPVRPDQYVRKGDLLMQIERSDYEVAVAGAKAALAGAKADFELKAAQSQRREQLTAGVVSTEERQRFSSATLIAEAAYHQTEASLRRAEINLDRTRIVSPVNGYVTNLTVRVGDYATAGARSLAIVDADSFWVDAYFEEGQLGRMQVGNHVKIALMGRQPVLDGRVQSVSRGIDVANAQPGHEGLAAVNPVYTWIRLAQRVPVRIAIGTVPPGLDLVVGLTASVQVEPSAPNQQSVPDPGASQPRP